MMMNKLINKFKNYFTSKVEGENIIVGVKTIRPTEKFNPKFNCATTGDRKRFFDNYNQNLLNRISDIKSNS